MTARIRLPAKAYYEKTKNTKVHNVCCMSIDERFPWIFVEYSCVPVFWSCPAVEIDP
jgi:hypothetical protein